MRIHQKDLDHLFQRKKKIKKSKYNNKRVEFNGWKFDSQLECDFYQHLLNLQSAGQVTRIFRQVPIHLAPGSKLVVDFEVKFQDKNDVEYFDTKGMMTDNARTKIKLAEHLYKIKINIIKRSDFISI